MNTNYAPRPYAVSANRLFTLADALFGDRPAPETQGWVPPVDVTETETHYELAAELPGVNATEVKVVVRDGVLSLNGERPALPAVENIKAHLAERRFGAFERRFSLPKDADGERGPRRFQKRRPHHLRPQARGSETKGSRNPDRLTPRRSDRQGVPPTMEAPIFHVPNSLSRARRNQQVPAPRSTRVAAPFH